MKTSQVALQRRQVALDVADGRLPEAQIGLDKLISQIGVPTRPAMIVELCHCLIDRVYLNYAPSRWREILRDLRLCRYRSRGLDPSLRRLILHDIATWRAKLMALPGTPAYSPEKALKAARKIRELGVDTSQADELECNLAANGRDWGRLLELSNQNTRFFDQGGWAGATASYRLNACRAQLELARTDEVVDHLALAESELQRAESYTGDRGTPEQKVQADRLRGLILYQRGKYSAAWDRLELALSGIEALAGKSRSLFNEQAFLQDKAGLYHDALAVALAMGGPGAALSAWSVAERSKSFYLCQLVAAAEVPLFADVDSEQLNRLRAADQKLTANEQILNSRSPVELAPADRIRKEHECVARSRERQELFESMMRSNPRWASLERPPGQGLEAMIEDLDPDWAVLSYYWRPSASGAVLDLFFAGRDRKVDHWTEPWSREELEQFARHRETLLHLRHGPESVRLGLLPPGLPSRKILPPTVLEALEPEQCLLISPHDHLQAFPIHALSVGPGERLIDRHPVLYIPSLSLLPLRKPVGPRGSVLLVGCEEDGFFDEPLRKTPEEIESLSRIWTKERPGRVESRLIPKEGTLDQAGIPHVGWGPYEFIHLSCHGVFPDDRPLDAALRLGAQALRVSDFFNTRLGAEMVSLSACSLGRHARRHENVALAGGEWIGIHLPLFYAGARTVVASLWDANAEKADAFMRELHTALAGGSAPPHAFRAAFRAIATGPPAVWANWYLAGFPGERTLREEEVLCTT